MFFNDLESHYYWYRWLYSQRDLNLLFNEFPGITEKKPCKSLIFIPLNGHWMKTNEINNGRMHVANKIKWIGIEDPETLNYNKST